MVRVTEVVPDPDEPVTAMIGCWALMSGHSCLVARFCLAVRDPKSDRRRNSEVSKALRDLVSDGVLALPGRPSDS